MIRRKCEDRRGTTCFSGDLIFDAIECQNTQTSLNGEALMLALSKFQFAAESLPANRVRELLTKAHASSLNGALSILDPYGMAIMADMLRVGELDLNAGQILSDWCGDTITKHRSFAATLDAKDTISAIRTLMHNRRL